MQARRTNIASIVPAARKAPIALGTSAEQGGVPKRASLLIAVATVHPWNLFNAATRQVAGQWVP